MKKRSVLAGMILMLAVTAGSSSVAYGAGEGNWVDYLQAIGTKFGRGLYDVVSSPAEIPCTMAVDMEEQPAAGFFTGLGKGTVRMFRRILSGVTEVGTFMIPMDRILPPVCHEPAP